MPYTDFHYTPTGTGVISGKEVLEQTEDAINDLGTQISGDVQTAIDTANNALNVANTASSDAQNAVNTANTAYTAATNAQNTANTAQNTANNALTAAQNAQNDVNALGNRVTTAEGNITQNTNAITGLTTRMGTAEGNITTLQNDVITAQGTATSAQNTATMARQQAYVLRYSSTAITDNSTIAYSTLDNTDNIKASDKIIDTDGKIFSVVSVDSDNSTVTVGSALIDLALDANVMHLTGNETANGGKTFRSDLTVANTDTTANIPNLNLRNYKADRGSVETSVQTIMFSDKNAKALTLLESRRLGNGNTSTNILCYNTDDNNNTVSGGVSVIRTKTATNFAPNADNTVTCGRPLAKWSDVQTYQINGLTPSSLSLPTDRGSRLDISGYFTNPGSGYTNDYSVLVNGYIFLNLTNVKEVTCYSLDAQSITNYAQTYQRSDDGQIYAFFPVRKDDKFRTLWYSMGGAVTVTGAYFIPCQGNV